MLTTLSAFQELWSQISKSIILTGILNTKK